jgi:hypothetical protein
MPRSFLSIAIAAVLLTACNGGGHNALLPASQSASSMPAGLSAQQMNVLYPHSQSPASFRAAPMPLTPKQASSAMASFPKGAAPPSSTMLSRKQPQSALLALNWTQISGSAQDVAVCPDGSVWVISPAYVYSSPYGSLIWHYVNGTWTNVPGAATRLACAPDNTLWAVNGTGNIYHLVGGAWSWFGAGASDISIGPDGSVYIISNVPGAPNGNGIWHYISGGWTQLPGEAVSIAASWDIGTYFDDIVPGGNYVTNAFGGIYYYNPSTGYVLVPGGANEVAPTTSGGGLFAIGYPSDGIFYNDLSTGTWTTLSGNALRVATNGSTVCVVNSAGGIYCASVLQPIITINPPAAGATEISGKVQNVPPGAFATLKVVVYALTNEWYVQPTAANPYTPINPDGSWSTFTNPWTSLVALLVNPSNYSPVSPEFTNPVFDPGVLAWTIYPSQPVSLNFSGFEWAIKTTGNQATDQFDPGPNYWSNDPSVVSVQPDGLHLNIVNIGGHWQSAEVYLLEALSYGTYTVQVASYLDQLDLSTVAAPIFLYAGVNQEVDNEYSGSGGLIPSPYNAQFVVQPYTVPGNLYRYVQPHTNQFTVQVTWTSAGLTFESWAGWGAACSSAGLGSPIAQWTYSDGNNPPPGAKVHINLWLNNGNAPVTIADSTIIHCFSFMP